MSVKIVFLFIFRLLILLLSLATLACHIGQLILLSQVDNTGPWWPNYVPYILYYVGPIASILSSTILLLIACIAAKSLWSDRILSIINLLLFIAIIVYNSLRSGTIPWTGSVPQPFRSNMKGFVTYCSNYDDSLSSIRCWLTNGTWLGMVVVGFFWFLFALYTVILKNSSVYDEDYDEYDFKEDVPMASTSQSPITHQQSLQPNHQQPMSHYSYHSEPTYASQKQEINYYPTQQQQPMYDDYQDYYHNPSQEQQMNSSHPSNGSQGGGVPMVNGAIAINDGFERSRKISKTYLGDEDQGHVARMSPMNSPIQSPHAYEAQPPHQHPY